MQLAAYSYDNGIAPYTGENPNLLKVFNFLIRPDITYGISIEMNDAGQY